MITFHSSRKSNGISKPSSRGGKRERVPARSRRFSPAKMLAEQERTGLPPAYLPKDEREREPARDTDDGGES